MTKLLAALTLAVGLQAPAAAHDEWSVPFKGVRLLHRSSAQPRWNINAVVIDLNAPGVRISATAPEERGRTVSAFGSARGAAVAVNAAFYNAGFGTHGVSVGEGRRWADTSDQVQSAQLASDGNRVELVPAERILEPEAWMSQVVSGHPIIVDEGRAIPSPEPMMAVRHPRTAAGITRDGRTLILLVVDGRQSSSAGMTGPELAAVMLELGAWKALNLDGGGSSTMYLRGQGVVNRPSDGRERTVANHLAIYAHDETPAPTLSGCGILSPNTLLGPGEARSSCGGRYSLVHQLDGNVVLYDLERRKPLWHTRTHGRRTSLFAVQGDGNVVLYNGERPLWHTRTHGRPGSVLAVQDDGNLVVYAPGNRPIWASNTVRRR